MNRRFTTCFSLLALLAACAEEPPPRSVQEFLDNPILLEAAMVRCSQDRSRTKYEAECVNARQAVARIQAKEEAERQKRFEAQSEQKRRALRRTQAAAAEARRRSAEAERRREEAEYLAQFGVLPPADGEADGPQPEGNLPQAVVPEAGEPQADEPSHDTAPVVSGSAAPAAEPAAEAEPAVEAEPETAPEPESPSDLASIRDELRRRSEEDGN